MEVRGPAPANSILNWTNLCSEFPEWRRVQSAREETQGDLLLNLASSAGLPADFPLDAADFANEPGTADKMFSKICIAAQALWKILLEICRNCRYFMVCLGKKCCGERFKYAG